MYRRVKTHESEDRPQSRDVSPASSDPQILPDYSMIVEQLGEEESPLSLPTVSESVETFEPGEGSVQDKAGYDTRATVAPSPKEEQPSAQNPWRPGFLVRMPWLGLLAIFVNISCTIASVIVLMWSNDSEVKAWNKNWQPSVWLSAASTLANLSLGLALAEGLNIIFWREASKGSDLNDLHTYAGGASLIATLSSLFRGNRNLKTLAVISGCGLTTLSTFRGPVIQKASLVGFMVVKTSGTMTLNVAQRLDVSLNPLGVTTGSSITDTDSVISYLTSNFSQIALNFTNREDVYIDAPDCGDNCTATVKGFGFQPTCINSTTPFNGSNSSISSAGVIVFESSVNYSYNFSASGQAPNTQLALNSTFLPIGLNTSSLSSRNCTLDRAIVEYQVFISGDTIRRNSIIENNYLQSDDLYIPTASAETEIISGMPFGIASPYGSISAVQSIVAGFGYYLGSLFNSTSLLSFESFGDNSEALQAGNWSLQSKGINANQYMSLGTGWTITDNTTWEDPMTDMLNQTHELAFRIAVQTAINNPDRTYAQTVPYIGQRTIAVYRSDYRIMSIAILINFLGLLSVLPLYYGWWELGRKSSLGVLETAKAFGAPVLRDVDDSATAEQILKRVGKTRVVYREVIASARSSGEFLIPRKGVRGRLQIVEEERGRSSDLFGLC